MPYVSQHQLGVARGWWTVPPAPTGAITDGIADLEIYRRFGAETSLVRAGVQNVVRPFARRSAKQSVRTPAIAIGEDREGRAVIGEVIVTPQTESAAPLTGAV